MSGILDLINNGVGKQIIENISNKVGTSEGETTNVLNSALPLLVNAMQNNLSTETDATGLLGALLNDKQNSNSLENPKSLVNDGIETQDGSKILKHILGNNQSLLEKNISLSTGIATDKINSILQMAAPLLMSFLAGKAKSANIQNGTDLVGLLENILGKNSSITSMLDQDGDGKLSINDAMAVANKKGGISGLLGKLFGK
ncbi:MULTISPECIES: DUF937 domain-containing protein [Flavobacterium]|uniref:DUF937 domain-containing protein n=2 Tax=Flavobacterium TaxID=237 RepID=A0A2N9PDM8_9FLAO|nr:MULTISPECIES: DUF937 domain-containing protein [Flavobacterium]QYS88900.1 DUF937 domain-containing protein [Flavobacterium davisii]RVU90099.1 DUF937 domain-containing protein [Flavobacterium columnare]SPE78435.1 hypothetical protein FLACOL_02451 [Flavobacterium columnare]